MKQQHDYDPMPFFDRLRRVGLASSKGEFATKWLGVTRRYLSMTGDTASTDCMWHLFCALLNAGQPVLAHDVYDTLLRQGLATTIERTVKVIRTIEHRAAA
jgi:hypothetical protein